MTDGAKNVTRAFVSVVVIGVLLVSVWKWVLQDKWADWQLKRTSDAKVSKHLKVGGDNYLGYFFVTSPRMRLAAAQEGLGIDFTDDGGDYATRLQKFADGQYDMIMLPVNSYLLHGAKHNFPGVISSAIAESKGADGIACYGDSVPTGKVSDLNNASLKFVYTGESPSSFLLDLTITDFDLFNLKGKDGSWRVEVASSRDVYQKAKKREGDCFVLWEPDLSKVLQLPGMKYIWGSDKFGGYIVDVFVFRREFVKKNPDSVRKFFRTYFRVMSAYANNREEMIDDMRKVTGEKKDAVEGMLKKIHWFDLYENAALQFGIAREAGDRTAEGVVNTILASTDILLKTGKLPGDPLRGDPYRITDRSILEELIKTGVAPVAVKAGSQVTFSSLDDAGWSQLHEIGTMRVEPINFQAWNNLLSAEGKEQVDKIATMLTNNYPTYRVVVRGHTGPGDEAMNVKLSSERAQAVMQYMIAVYSFDPNRLRAEGFGSRALPSRRPGESPREYNYRLDRVEFVLFEGNAL